MTPGPRTVRPSIGAGALLERMVEQKLTSFVITTPDGRLVGLVRRQDLEANGARDATRPQMMERGNTTSRRPEPPRS
jgi:hypothetical protein